LGQDLSKAATTLTLSLKMESRLPGFYRWPIERRRAHLVQLLGHGASSFTALDPGALSLALADKLIENVIGVLGLPVGLGLNLKVNGEDFLVPMAIEEPSVVAAFSHAAKIARHGGGFIAEADPSLMIGQIQLCPDSHAEAEHVLMRLEGDRDAIAKAVRGAIPQMESRGGGLRRIEYRKLDDPEGGPPMVVIHLVIDVLDAMGANTVNHAAESAAPEVARISGLEPNLRILSNLAAHRLARASVSIPLEDIGGEKVGRRIAEADRLARIDPYRAATHNKGLLNGIDAVAIATGNDWRSIEAGAHAWAARSGRYSGLTRWVVEGARLEGSIELPLAVGTVGGSTRGHPTIALLRDILCVQDARHLACVLASVGLAQNFAALRALATEGIQRGHMELHARQVAIAAGANATEVDGIVTTMLETGRITAEFAALEIQRRRVAVEGDGGAS
jgi:hydroxymethylglutaryl-CoA reductase